MTRITPKLLWELFRENFNPLGPPEPATRPTLTRAGMISVQRAMTEHFLADIWDCCRIYQASVMSGFRTIDHNRNVGGHENSKHTEHGGWGLSVDLWFDDPGDRPVAMEWLHDRNWHTHVGELYDNRRLHVQAMAYGRQPPNQETSA